MARLSHAQGPASTAPSSPSAQSSAAYTPSAPSSPNASIPRSSFSFMRRTQSSEPPSSSSGEPSVLRKKSLLRQEVASRSRLSLSVRRSSKQQERDERLPREPPRIPSQVLPATDISSFAPEAYTHSPITYSPSLSSPRATLFPTRSTPAAVMPATLIQVDKTDNVVPIIAIPVPPGSKQQATTSKSELSEEPTAKSGSIANRGRFSTVQHGDVVPARKMRRRKDPSAFNILVVGTKGAGKTSFIEFLKTSLTQNAKRRTPTTPREPPAVSEAHRVAFTSHYVETDVDDERIGVTIYDSKGLERHVVDLQLREMTSFVESKFQETFSEEQKVVRTPGVQDTHIHCVILLLDPSRLDANVAMSAAKAHEPHGTTSEVKPNVSGCLDEHLDIDVFHTLHSKATVIPLISKADTVTTAHMAHLKRSVADCVKELASDGTHPYAGLHLDDDAQSDIESTSSDDDDGSTNAAGKLKNGKKIIDDKVNADTPPTTPSADRLSSGASIAQHLPLLPMSIISPDTYEPGRDGRRFPWGLADPNNPGHCDFVLFKDSLFWEWKDDLRQASRERWYEGWRTSRLKRTNTMMPIYPTKNGRVRGASGTHSDSRNGSSEQKLASGCEERHHSVLSSGEGSAISSPEKA